MTGQFCDRCGRRLDGSSPPGAGGGGAAAGEAAASTVFHDQCRAAREFEPPRYCAGCGRRLAVQVMPGGWIARCAEHGSWTHESR